MSIFWSMPRVSLINKRLADVNAALALLVEGKVSRTHDDERCTSWLTDTRKVENALMGAKQELELQLVRAIRRHKGKAP